MNLVEYTYGDGYKHLSWLRDQDPPDKAQALGIPHDPPELTSLNLPDEQARALHNLLVERRLVIWQNSTDFKGKLVTSAAGAGLEGEQIAQLVKLYSHGPPAAPILPFDLETALNALPITSRQLDCIKRTFAQAGITNLAGVENAPRKTGHICGLDIYQVIALLLGK